MAELSAFAGAPPQVREREAQLMKRADLVLTGGPSLYAAEATHESSRALPAEQRRCGALLDRGTASGDDDDGAARRASCQGDIAEPRLGYFGVIDERMDLDLRPPARRCRSGTGT